MQRPTAVPDPTQLLQLAQASQGQPGGNLGQYVTAAMLAAGDGGCTCETCKLMRQAGREMRKNLVTE